MKDFEDVLNRITKGEYVSSEELAELILFVGEGESTSAQRAGVMAALCIHYHDRFREEEKT